MRESHFTFARLARHKDGRYWEGGIFGCHDGAEHIYSRSDFVIIGRQEKDEEVIYCTGNISIGDFGG